MARRCWELTANSPVIRPLPTPRDSLACLQGSKVWRSRPASRKPATRPRRCAAALGEAELDRQRPLWFLSAPSGPEPLLMKRTFQPHNTRRARTHGFRARMATAGGRKVINNRRRKGRKRLAVTIWKK